MARIPKTEQNPEDDRMREARPQEPKRRFRMGWVLVPLALVVMAYMLSNAGSSLGWNQIMDLLQVRDRQRYTMLFHLCLTITVIVAAVRILGSKEKK